VAKVLSVKQPWLSAIEVGMKIVDVRTWKTDYRGPVLLHASKEYDYTGEKALGEERMAVLRKHGIRRGGIVARATLEAMIPYLTKDMFGRQHSAHLNPAEWWQKDTVGWVFSNVEPVQFIAVNGQLGLWDYGT